MPGADECAETTASGVTGTACTCTTDLCNGAARLDGALVSVVLAVIALITML